MQGDGAEAHQGCHDTQKPCECISYRIYDLGRDIHRRAREQCLDGKRYDHAGDYSDQDGQQLVNPLFFRHGECDEVRSTPVAPSHVQRFGICHQ